MTTTSTKARGKATRVSKTQAPKTQAPKAKRAGATKKTQPETPKLTAAEVTNIPLSQLVRSAQNVRKGPAENIPELADNIAALGILSSLIVSRAAGGDIYAVDAGERRRQALMLLCERGQIPADYPVPCRVLAEGATEASLSENIHRQAMNPADQFEAWAALADEGQTPAEIARRHGASQRLVKARLRLGRLAPRILNALRDGDIDLESAQAFCWTEDHEAQKAAFEAISQGMPSRINPYVVRRVLTETHAEAHDCRVAFVGEEAYRAAGGTVREDLFGESRTFPDTALLTRLCMTKLAEAAEGHKAEGWADVVASIDRDDDAMQGMRPLNPREVGLSDEDEAEHNRLMARIEELEEADFDDETAQQERAAAEEALAMINARRYDYLPEDKARATLFLWLVHGGEIYATPYAKPLPAATEGPDTSDSSDSSDSSDTADSADTIAAAADHSGPAFGPGLQVDMAAIRRVTQQADLVANPQVAQDLLRFHLIRRVLVERIFASPFQGYLCQGAAQVRSVAGDMGRLTARSILEDTVGRLPFDWVEIEDKADSFRAFRGLDEAEKVALFAYTAALSLNGTLAGSMEDTALTETLREIGADPARHWTPDAAFFERLTKAHILAIMRELFGLQIADKHSGDKKARLAERMAFYFDDSRTAADRGLTEEAAAKAAAWTPEPMRTTPRPGQA